MFAYWAWFSYEAMLLRSDLEPISQKFFPDRIYRVYFCSADLLTTCKHQLTDIMEDIYNDSATAQAEADHLRKSRDVPLFENLHKFYAHVHEDVMQKFPKDTLILMAAHPAAQTKQQHSKMARKIY
jgi:hypothetical protein